MSRPAPTFEREPTRDGRSPLAFLVLVLGLSVPFWVGGAVIGGTAFLPAGLPVTLFQFVCPLLTASYLTYRRDGRAAVGRLLRRTWSLRGLESRWLWGVALVPACGLLTYALLPVAGVSRGGPHEPLGVAALMLVAGFLMAGAEETGWTGYAAGPLRARYGALGAGVVLGVVWAAWHVPALLQAHRPALWIAGWALGTIAGRILIVRLVENTGGAVVVAVAVHDLMIVTTALIPHFEIEPRPAVAVLNGLIMALAAAAVVLVGRRHPGPALRTLRVGAPGR